MRPEDRIGKAVGIFTVLSIDRDVKKSNRIYVCECNFCQSIFLMSYAEMKCANKCTHLGTSGRKRNYGYAWRNKRLKHIFNGMKSRCYDKNDKNYRWYGAKGIGIYDEWMDNPNLFENWALSNGYKDGLTIDRIDCNGDYCPENCRWITSENNAGYKSTTRILTVNGESHTGREWAGILGIGTNVINTYVRFYGIENTIAFIEKVIDNPSLKEKRKSRHSYYELYMN